ncbi:MAG: acetyl-CoA carboxylase biotin carboxylase subunit, partial [Sneathiella sp.]|nr:acetyl-CoA carboxylase biotin carboxylase subunit [Sneathiella sp.]
MSFDTVLIANRGEIAVRLINACKSLDLKTVAVFSDADRNAPFVTLADEAIHIGPAEAASSYLDMDKLVRAAQTAGADAIHPGYGFLAENAVFAEKCGKAGIIFIGPRPDIIKMMGSKIEAKAAAIKAGVPVVPGYHGSDLSVETLKREAQAIGVPLMIKASAGGGGRGMRLVQNLELFEGELRLAQQEALSAFGDPAILLERYIEKARHIEVQIIGDHHGNIVHLYERDCSVQRNHQKIIEEAPAPNFPQSVRSRMFDAALSLCSGIGYDSVGTVEFMYEPGKQEFYFLEMNTRLQVEHPVTEAVTGIDIVQWQIRVAMKESIPFSQNEIQCRGWAIEARVAAENPAEDYRPETGTLEVYEEPTGPGVRVDSGIQRGSEISHYYDSMLAKVIVTADSRDAAIRRLKRAISAYNISGVTTNIPFLADVLNLRSFEEGDHHTSILEQEFADGWCEPSLEKTHLAEAALAGYLGIAPVSNFGPWHSLGAWRGTAGRNSTGATYLTLRFSSGNDLHVVVRGSNGDYEVSLEGIVILRATRASFDAGILSYEQEGRLFSRSIYVSGQRLSVHSAAGMMDVDLLLPEQVFLVGKKNSQNGGNQILAPKPGLVVDILISEG